MSFVRSSITIMKKILPERGKSRPGINHTRKQRQKPQSTTCYSCPSFKRQLVSIYILIPQVVLIARGTYPIKLCGCLYAYYILPAFLMCMVFKKKK